MNFHVFLLVPIIRFNSFLRYLNLNDAFVPLVEPKVIDNWGDV